MFDNKFLHTVRSANLWCDENAISVGVRIMQNGDIELHPGG